MKHPGVADEAREHHRHPDPRAHQVLAQRVRRAPQPELRRRVERRPGAGALPRKRRDEHHVPGIALEHGRHQRPCQLEGGAQVDVEGAIHLLRLEAGEGPGPGQRGVGHEHVHPPRAPAGPPHPRGRPGRPAGPRRRPQLLGVQLRAPRPGGRWRSPWPPANAEPGGGEADPARRAGEQHAATVEVESHGRGVSPLRYARPPSAGVVQLVRTPACHAGGRRFESGRSRSVIRLAATSRQHRRGAQANSGRPLPGHRRPPLASQRPRPCPGEAQADVRELSWLARRWDGRSARKDQAGERAARDRVHAAKVALGERGPRWWEAGTEDGDG